MTEEEVKAVAAIEKATFPRPWSEESFRREVTANVAARYLVAEKNGRVIGYAGAWVVLDECHITNIAVAEEERGRGYGSRLLEALLRTVSSLGAAWADLEVRVSNACAQHVYAKAGFVSVGKRKRYYEDNGEDAFLMVCERLPEADPAFEEPPHPASAYGNEEGHPPERAEGEEA
ncbi:MAG: ribosomal protein S18-alanine N-acetyltransferase [Clostridia bacterium]|nr:ribosomal protein S18-alanine N-acetyltransferase [Clostridia bacterium]